jgi:ABC-type cobalamin/Fe3+-siderophores transport system ATPase subunit
MSTICINKRGSLSVLDIHDRLTVYKLCKQASKENRLVMIILDLNDQYDYLFDCQAVNEEDIYNIELYERPEKFLRA